MALLRRTSQKSLFGLLADKKLSPSRPSRNQAGQSTSEYVMTLAGLALLVVGAIYAVGTWNSNQVSHAAKSFSATVGGGSGGSGGSGGGSGGSGSGGSGSGSSGSQTGSGGQSGGGGGAVGGSGGSGGAGGAGGAGGGGQVNNPPVGLN